MRKICSLMRNIVLISLMRNICTRFAQYCTYFPNAQYMRKICARLYFFLQCPRFAHDCTYFPNAQYMCKICARLYFFLQCATYVQDLCKIVLISQCAILRNIYARFVQHCTSLSNVQYIHKTAGIIGKNMSHIIYLPEI